MKKPTHLERVLATDRAQGTKSRYLRWEPGETTFRLVTVRHLVTPLDLEMEWLPQKQEEGDIIDVDFHPVRKHFRPAFANCGKYYTYNGMAGVCDLCDQAAAEQDDQMAAATSFQCNVVVIPDDPEEDLCYQVAEFPKAFIAWFMKTTQSKAYKGMEWFGPQGQDILYTKDPKNKDPRARNQWTVIPERGRTEIDFSYVKGFLADPFCSGQQVPDRYKDLLDEARAIQKGFQEEGKGSARVQGLSGGLAVKAKAQGEWVTGVIESIDGDLVYITGSDGGEAIAVNKKMVKVL